MKSDRFNMNLYTLYACMAYVQIHSKTTTTFIPTEISLCHYIIASLSVLVNSFWELFVDNLQIVYYTSYVASVRCNLSKAL